MSVLFPVTDLQERVRIRCGLPAFSANSNVTDAMILSILQESCRDLANIMSGLDWYFVTTSNLVTVANNPLVSLPANFAALQHLVWIKSSTQKLPLNTANLEDVRPAVSSETWESKTPQYRITGQSLEFFPTPTSVYNLEARYSTGSFITSSADTYVAHLGWDTWVVYNACSIVCEHQEKDDSAFLAKRDRKLIEIMSASKRDKNAIVQPRDVRGRGYPYDPTDPWEMY